MSTPDQDSVAEDVAQQLDSVTGLGWFCDAIDNDMTGTGLVEIACRHAAATPGFPVTEARFRKAAAAEGGSARRFFSILAAVAGSSPGWPALRDAIAEGVSEIANKIAAGEPYRAGAAPAPAAPVAQAPAPAPRPEPKPAETAPVSSPAPEAR
jgi:hypothetical protein